MFIVISHINGTCINLVLEDNDSGDVKEFTTETKAEEYAVKNCAWDWSVVEL